MKTVNYSENIDSNNQKNKKTIILGFSIPLIIIILCLISLHLFFSYNNKEIDGRNWHNFMSMLLFIMVCSGILKFIGTKTPILKNIGGGSLLCLLVPAFIFNYNFGNEGFSNFQKAFQIKSNFLAKNENSIGFFDFFVSALILGSLISIKKEFFSKMLKKFLPLVIISLILSSLIVGLISCVFDPKITFGDGIENKGNPFLNSLFFIFIPISCGGITCGVMPLMKIFAQGKGTELENAFKNHILPALLIAGIFSVILSGLIKKIWGGSKYSSPNKMIEKNITNSEKDKNKAQNVKKEESNINFANISTGFIIIFSFYIFSNILRQIISKFFKNYLNLSIEIYLPPIVIFLVILVIFVKFFDLISFYYTKCIFQASQLITIIFTNSVIFLLGIATDINQIQNAITNVPFLLTCMLFVIVTASLAAFIGNKLGYYPVQSAIVGGLCANSIGGVGNMAILEASDSMELTPYAQISTRLGGDIVVILTSILFPLLYVS